MRELVEVLAAVAAGVPRHRHGFHRSEALPPQEPPRVWVSMVTLWLFQRTVLDLAGASGGSSPGGGTPLHHPSQAAGLQDGYGAGVQAERMQPF